MAGVPFLVHAWATLNGYFGQDDFILTYRAAHAAPYDLGFLFQDYSGHLQPGAFLLAWIVTAVAPLNHTVAVLPLLAVHAVTLWLCWRVLTRLFGRRWAILPPFAVFAASPLILFPTLWWAYAMQLFPLLLAMFAALHAHLRYLDGSRPRHAVAGRRVDARRARVLREGRADSRAAVRRHRPARAPHGARADHVGAAPPPVGLGSRTPSWSPATRCCTST